jgi:hypothetical protein
MNVNRNKFKQTKIKQRLLAASNMGVYSAVITEAKQFATGNVLQQKLEFLLDEFR